MQKKIFSLQYKFLLITLCVTILSSLIVGGLSYIKSVNIIEKQVSQSNYNTIMQMADNIDTILNSMDSSAMYLWRDEDFIKCLQKSEEVERNLGVYTLNAQHILNSFVAFEPIIYSVYLQAYNGMVFDTASASNQVSSEMEKKLIELKGEGTIISDTVTNYDNTKMNVVAFLKVLKDPNRLSENLAIIKINISEDTISQIYGTNKLCANSQTVIVNDDYTVISDVKKDNIGTCVDKEYLDQEYVRESSGYFLKKIDGQDMMITYVELVRPGWKLLNIVPLNELAKDNVIIRNITVSAVLLGSVFCLLISLFFSIRILSPLKALRKSMDELEHENFDIVLSEKGNDEISLVSKSFNKMSKKLNELINEVYIVQLKQKEAELRALHEQINPHFLYNTLNTIYWICQLEKAVESGKLVQALSKLFRLSLNSGKDITTVEKEIEHLNYYILIQKARFEEAIRFQIEVEEALLKYNVVKLILQPLVENAIHHGIEKKGGEGTITVKIFREQDALVYEVEDDGIGADVNELYGLLHKVQDENRGFGLKSVNDRIRFHYGAEYGLEFYSETKKGMKVVVRQPL